MDSFFSHPFVWFLLGAFCHRFLSRLFAYVHAINVYNDALVSGLSIYRLADQRLLEINKARYEHIEKTGDMAKLKSEKDIDEAILAMWRTVCISSLINNMPKTMRRLAKFHDWNSAMKWLDKLIQRPTVNKWGQK